MNVKEYVLKDGSKLQFKQPAQKEKYNVDDFNDNTTNMVVALNDGVSRISAHNKSGEAHSDIRSKISDDISAHNTSSESHKNIQRNLEKYATDKDAEVLTAAQAYADVKAVSAHNALESHNTDTAAHSDIRANPSYSFTATGGAVQRFDNVNAAKHKVNITVHGATDSEGNSVANPKVGVYGKNLFKTIHKSDGKGYESVGSIIKITNPTAATFVNNTTTKYHDSFILGKGTYTLSVETVGQAELASGAYFQIMYKLGDVQSGLGIPKLNKKYSKILTVDSPTVFSFSQVNMGKVPTSADLSVQIQLEVGSTATDFAEAVEPQTANPSITIGEGEMLNLETFNAVSPTMTVISTDDNALVSTVDVTYYRDSVKHSDIDVHNTDNNAHGALFGSVNTQLQGISGGLEAAVEKGNTTADTVALLQKYPCYEYSTSGGAVQRFDEVSVIPHTIGVTVHGATDENGNSVTNPTVSVYGKNMHVFNYKNIRGYTFSGSNCKIVNPTQFHENPNNPSLLLPAGTYTFSCRVTGSREYANKPSFSAFFYIGETQTNIDMNNFVSGTRTFKKTFTVTEPTAFRFNNVWFIETPTSADLSLDFQLEVSSTATDYEPYTEPQTVTVPMTFADGEVVNLTTFNAVSPIMTVIATDDNAVVSVVDVTYNRDVKKALDKLEAAIAALV